MYIPIYGNPVPNKSVRTYRQGRTIKHFDPNAQLKREVRAYVRQYVSHHFPDWRWPEHPELTFVFHMPIPKSLLKRQKDEAESGLLKHDKRPDGDNLIKLYVDCLKDIAFGDDSTVQYKGVYKSYHAQPKVNVYIEEGGSAIPPFDWLNSVNKL